MTLLRLCTHNLPVAICLPVKYNRGMKKNLKNYRAEVLVERSVARIEEILVRHGTTQFYKEYKNSELVGVVFVVPVLNGELPVKLPARVEQVRQRLYGKRSTYTPAMNSQAQRTAWANIRDWIDAQMALIETLGT
jgi:hypothetical protein